MIFDTHAHYDDKAFDEDREEMLASLPENGIGNVVNVCASINSLRRIIPLTEKYPYVWGAAGVHPDYAEEMTEEMLEEIRKVLQHEKIRAVGEIGLDYYWHKEPENHKRQQEMFRAQMDIAREEKIPFMIHSRDAAEDTLEILVEYFGKDTPDECPGVMHCYSYSKETAEILLKTGLYFGIGAVVTYKNAKKLARAVEAIPMDRIVLETDYPYLAPDPYRGKRNYSGYLTRVVERIAELKGITPEEVAKVTWNNACRLYRL